MKVIIAIFFSLILSISLISLSQNANGMKLNPKTSFKPYPFCLTGSYITISQPSTWRPPLSFNDTDLPYIQFLPTQQNTTFMVKPYPIFAGDEPIPTPYDLAVEFAQNHDGTIVGQNQVKYSGLNDNGQKIKGLKTFVINYPYQTKAFEITYESPASLHDNFFLNDINQMINSFRINDDNGTCPF